MGQGLDPPRFVTNSCGGGFAGDFLNRKRGPKLPPRVIRDNGKRNRGKDTFSARSGPRASLLDHFRIRRE